MYTASFDNFKYKTDDPVFYNSINAGKSEPYPGGELDLIKKYLELYPNKCRTYIDIGAHLGTTIMPMTRLFKNIHGFEPNPPTFELLSQNIALNDVKNVNVYNCGISNSESSGTIRRHGDNSGCYYIDTSNDGSIKTITLDSLELSDVDFIKIDVAGNELNVLKGAINTIMKYKPLIELEINHCSKTYFGIDPEDIFSFLRSLHYVKYGQCHSNYFFRYESPYILNKTIFCFWTGTNEITPNRLTNLQRLKDKTGCEVKLVTPDNLPEYILSEYPLHEAYQYLSETHKADYLRTYFMHFHGGGYTDIKDTEGSWIQAFDDILSNPNKYINSYVEFHKDCIVYEPAKIVWDKMAGNCAYICRPGTPFTEKWYSEMISVLDKKLPLLRINPATNPQDCAPNGSGYPITWSEILGQIFHKICYEYLDYIMQTVPRISVLNYR